MSDYIGRFAPSPTGPLHAGSLYTALASYLDARHHQGQWLLRIEDLDPPREQPGATASILRSLHSHALHWDGDVLYQSQRHARYQARLDELLANGEAFYCDCSRKMLASVAPHYPGTCHTRHTTPTKPEQYAIRLLTNGDARGFTDQLLAEQHQTAAPNGLYNDFVIKRRDQLFAYQLAVVVDDIDQAVTHVVRGSDILDSTFKQGYLYEKFQQPVPTYLHLPVLTHADGQKLSKQNYAPAIDDQQPANNLRDALRLLNQPLPPAHYDVADILAFAIEHWSIDHLTACLALPAEPRQTPPSTNTD